MMKLGNYTTIVMSGGGIKGLGLLGALQYLADKHKLNNINKYIGTSVGAIIGYLIAIGYSPIEIMVSVNQQKIIEKLVNAFNVMDLLNQGGVLNFFMFQEILEDMTISKVGHLLTLTQLHYEFGKHLVCCTYNHSKRECEYVDYISHPNMPCLVALRMTSNFPFLFQPFYYEGQMYLDGALIDGFPISQIQPNEISLGIKLTTSHTTITTTKKHRKPFRFIDYVFEILSISLQQQSHFQHSNIDIITIPLHIDMFHFQMNTATKFDCFSIGYETIRKFDSVNFIIPHPTHF